jgi:hypothetical protein
MPDSTATPIFARARNSAEPTPAPEPLPPLDDNDPWTAVAHMFDFTLKRLAAINLRFNEISQRLDALEAKAAQPPANRVIKHVRGSDGQITKSILVADGQ